MKLVDSSEKYYKWNIFEQQETNIVVPKEPTVLELLEQIKELQLPKAKELIPHKVHSNIKIITP